MSKTNTQPLCSCHGKPVADDSTLCPDGTDELVDTLRRLTADIARGDREPRRHPDGTIIRGDAGRGTSTIWDTPTGEYGNLPRALDEQTAKVAVRKSIIIGRTPMAEIPLPLDLQTVDAAGRIRLTVGQLASDLSGHPMPLDGYWSVPDVATWLIDQAETIRHRQDAYTILTDLKRAVAKAERHVDNPPDRKYLGICGATPPAPEGTEPPPDPCDGQVFSVDGAPRGRCNKCPATYDTTERRDQQWARLHGVRLTAAEIERVTTEYGRPVSRKNIQKWHERHRLNSDGSGRYLVDDVLLLAEQSAARRKSRAVS